MISVLGHEGMICGLVSVKTGTVSEKDCLRESTRDVSVGQRRSAQVVKKLESGLFLSPRGYGRAAQVNYAQLIAPFARNRLDIRKYFIRLTSF